MALRWCCLALFAPSLLTSAACSVDPGVDFALLAPVVAGDHLVVGERAAPDTASPEGADAEGHLLVLTPTDGRAAAPRVIPLSGPPTRVVALGARPATLALSRERRTVDLVDVSDAPAGPRTRTFDVGAPFEALSADAGGHFALAWFPPETASSVFHNENEVALLDLRADTPAPAAVSRRTLPSLGGAPRIVDFSPPVPQPSGEPRRYAFALSDEHVAILAADAPDRRERSVPLVSLTTGGDRTPTGLVFGVEADAAGASTLWAIVTTAESNAVYALAVTPRADAAAGEPDFDVSLSQLAGIGPGGAATLVELPDPEGNPRLFTLSTNPGAGTVTLTDVRTATGQTLGLSAGLNRIALFRGGSGALEALVHAGRATSTFHVIDLAALAAGDPRAYRTRTTREPFSRVLPIPGSTRFVVLKDSASDAVGLLDADTDRVAGFGRTGAVRDLRLEPDQGRLFVLTEVDGADYLVSIDLGDLHPESAIVPLHGNSLLSLPDSGTVATWTQAAGGTLVFWPSLDVREETAQAVPGLGLTDLLR